MPQESTGTEEPGSGGDSHALLLLTGLAGAVAGATRFGRGTSAGGRWPWSGQSATATIHKPFGGEQTFILMADGDAPRTYRFPQPVPEGGRMRSNSDGSVDVLDSNGDVDGRIKAPWAYDATGRPVRTWYEIDGDTLVQHIDPEPGSVYPILADPEYGPEQRAADEELANFIGPLRPEREAERRAAQQRLAANPEPVPFTPESWERAVTTDDLSVPDPGESGDPMLEGLHDIDESRNDSGTGGVAVTPESWERAVTTDELSVPPPGESGDPMLDRLHELGRRPFGAKEKGEGGDDNWEAEFGPLNVIGGIVDYPLQKLDVPAVGSPRPGVMKSAVNGVAGLGKGVPVLNWFVTAAAIASDLSSEEPPSIAESVTTNVGATVVAAAVGGTAMALGAAPVLVAAAGVAAGYGAAWVISKLF
ncbi:hypothetical protein AB4Z09_28335 [Rhodococcus sp. TAF43]|uniref:hypothetical protein n=1 Tax=Rhodococcus sp. TAF43 TaxID=3237483 RepID=UPI003F9485DF